MYSIELTTMASSSPVEDAFSKLSPIIPPHLVEALPNILRNIPDLSSEVEILGDIPAAYGALSYIWLGKLSNGQQVAVKRLKFTDIDEIFFRELVVWLRAMSHEHVLPLLGVARLHGSVAFISPYMPGRSLDVQLSACSIPDRLRILTEVASALAFLHRNNIIYGYLTMSTILLDQAKKAYLSSFLFSQTDWTELHKIDPRLYPNKTCPVYSPNSEPITWQHDVLAFGILLVLVFSKTDPLSRSQHVQLIRRLFPQKNFKETLGSPEIPEGIWDVARACCEDAPGGRVPMEQVYIRMSRILKTIEYTTNTESVFHPALKPIKNISPEIKRLSKYPIAGGGYCDLYLGERLGGEKVALKLVRLFGPSDKDKKVARRRFLSEVQIWGNLHHPRILEFCGICELEYGTLSVYMVSPFLQNGNIMQYLNKINPDANRRKLLMETAEGLVYLHNRDPPVIHGDLKGANILISDSGTAVLADFGLSRISHEMTSSVLHGAGSPRWMAPELMTADDTAAGPLRTTQSDVYGYGHIILEVLSNEKPFYNIRDDLRVLVELIHGRRPARPIGLIASQWLDDITWAYCQQCTDINPAVRPSMNDILGHLHELFNL